jgi:exopolyphosphatase / guanosine-5'-triphosphate,3'-diphosphate pyrophosphatase
LPDYKAVIDIGTNSFHLIIAEVTSDGKVNTIHRERMVIRMGTEGKEIFKSISPGEMTRAVKILNDYKKLSEFYKADLYAVATSAVRESDNKDDFIKTVRTETGIDIKVIDGREEASYIYYGVHNALRLSDKKILCVDIGGGSTEVIIGKNGKSDFIQSYKLGAVRLTKMFFKEYIITNTSIKECSEYINKVFSASELPEFAAGYDAAAGASGTILSIASVVASEKYGQIPEDLNGFVFTADELKQASKAILGAHTSEERTNIKGIDTSRAEIIPAGILILENLFSLLKIPDMSISGYALREGFLLSLPKKK